MKEKFIPKSVKTFPGPVSPAVISGDLAIISGQVSVDSKTGDVVKGTIKEETKRALENLKLIIEDMGLTLDAVLKCDVFLSSMNDFDEMNEVYKDYFGTECPPARTAVAVELWGGLKIEIGALVRVNSK